MRRADAEVVRGGEAEGGGDADSLGVGGAEEARGLEGDLRTSGTRVLVGFGGDGGGLLRTISHDEFPSFAMDWPHASAEARPFRAGPRHWHGSQCGAP